MKLLALGSLLLATACAPATPEDASQAAITGGGTDSTDRAVVLVHGAGAIDYEACTASFLTPRLLLTAAHCVADITRTYTIGPSTTYSFADSTPSPDDLFGVSSITLDPGYDDGAAAPRPHDLAVIHLSSDAGTATLPFHTGAPDSTWVGDAIHIVGYGATSSAPNSGSENTRRAVDTTIGSITSTELVITNGKQDCVGDSGGPALLTIDGVQTIVGVSSAASSDCKSAGYYGRIDGDAAFIDAQVASSGSPGGTTSGSTGSVQTGGGCSTTGSGAPRLFGMFALLIALGLRRRA